jgi:protein TonB
MDSPRSGFRRAAITSWALAAIGLAGVAGASTLAYADTVKPQPAEAPVDATMPADLAQTPAVNLPPVPEVVSSTDDPPPLPAPGTTEAPVPEVAPETTVDEAPVQTYTPTPEYTPEQTVEQAPAPVTHATQTPRVSAPPSTTQRRNLTPTTVMAPNYSPHVTTSRGS